MYLEGRQAFDLLYLSVDRDPFPERLIRVGQLVDVVIRAPVLMAYLRKTAKKHPDSTDVDRDLVPIEDPSSSLGAADKAAYPCHGANVQVVSYQTAIGQTSLHFTFKHYNYTETRMSKFNLNYSSLEECLQALNHLFIEIGRLKYEQGYEEIMGGYCELRVATLDSGAPASKLVAAKKLRLGIRASEPNRLAFRLARELKVWAGLRHPHVLPLLGFYLSDDCKTAVLISEYMTHGDLRDYIVKMKPTSGERLFLIHDLTQALAYLHTQDPPVRHGDLKPGNVLINSQRRALLADFGLSKALNTGPTGFTTGNDARGTVRYSSPEVLLHGTATQSLPDDIWSWGCLALEALTDKMPFADIHPEPQLILALVQGQIPGDINNLSLDAPQLKDLLSSCWSRQPEQRPTAVDCLRALNPSLLVLDASSNPSEHERSGTAPMAYLAYGELKPESKSGSSTFRPTAGEAERPDQLSSGHFEGGKRASGSRDSRSNTGNAIDGFEARRSSSNTPPSLPEPANQQRDFTPGAGGKNRANAGPVDDSPFTSDPLVGPLQPPQLYDSGGGKGRNGSFVDDSPFTFHPPDIPFESEHPRNASYLNLPSQISTRHFSAVDSVRGPSRFSRRLNTTDGIFERPQWL